MSLQAVDRMQKPILIAGAAGMVAAAPAQSEELQATFEIPRLEASNYRKPYVAIWLEDADRKMVETYAVHFKQSPIGDNWLPDLKTWWRRGGRAMKMSASGISRPTRSPGKYTIGLGSLNDLPPGKYALVVEAVRENGGREIIKAPFDWTRGKPVAASAQGASELGRVSITTG